MAVGRPNNNNNIKHGERLWGQSVKGLKWENKILMKKNYQHYVPPVAHTATVRMQAIFKIFQAEKVIFTAITKLTN